MKLRATIVLWLVSLSLLGCEKKRAKEPIALAKLPDLAYPVVLPPAVSSTSVQPPAVTPEEQKPVPKPAKNVKPRPRPQRPATERASTPSQGSTTPAGVTPRVTIGPSDTENNSSISAGLPHGDENNHRQSTAELIQMTEDNLRILNRQLSKDEQSQVEQIRNFLNQSRTATAENDLVRAHNLAMKAHLLSDELVRR